jgi:hypothetical protein
MFAVAFCKKERYNFKDIVQGVTETAVKEHL